MPDSSTSLSASVLAPLAMGARARGRAVALLLAALLPVAQAGPVTVAGVLAGLPGDSVSPTLVDANLVDFEAADLTVTYDPRVLQPLQFDAGAPVGPVAILAGVPTSAGGGWVSVALSYATGSGLPVSGMDVELLIAMFQILGTTAPGTTTVHFNTLNATLYDVDVEATITVLAPPVAVSEPGSAALALAGLAVVARSRRWRAARLRHAGRSVGLEG